MRVFNDLSSRYQRLAQGELPQDATRTRQDGVLGRVKNIAAWSSGRMRASIAGGLLFLVIVLSWWSAGPEETSIEPENQIVTQARYLHLLVTAPKKSLPSCRLLLSAAANHYPTPNLIAWGDVYNDPSLSSSGSHLGKVRGILDFLHTMGPERDNDTVLIPDPESTIFQLRPDVLMERYMEVNRQAEERLRQRLGEKVVAAQNLRQTIIFAASKACSGYADDATCYAVPESPLASGVYGSKTDTLITGEEGFPYLYARERFLSAGFMMGNLKAVKVLYEKVNELLLADQTKATEQDVLARIFGEQEFKREVLRDQNLGFWGRLWKGLGITSNSVLDAHPTHRKLDVEGAQLEYGIGLDYEGLLASDTLSEKMMGWVVHNNSMGLQTLRTKFDVTSSASNSLPADISRSFPPFWSRNPVLDHYPSQLGWKDVNLYTNLWTGSIPASIHHSIASTNPQNIDRLTTTNWESTWFHEFMRQKADDYATQPDRRFVTLRGAGEEVSWWSLFREKWKLKWSKQWKDGEERQDWVAWGDVCDGFADQLYRDGKGDWKSPIDDW